MRTKNVPVWLTFIYVFLNDFISVDWETKGKCSIPAGGQSGYITQTLSFDNYTETREEPCYKQNVEGKTDFKYRKKLGFVFLANFMDIYNRYK